MSTLKVDGIRSNSATSDAITLADNGTCTANITNNLSNRNLFINGDLNIWQRGTSTTSSGAYLADRFWAAAGTYARDNSAPDGFKYSAKLTYVSPNSMSIGQPIELPITGHSGSMIAGNKITVSFYGKCDSGTESAYCQIKFRDSKFSGTNEVNFTIADNTFTLTTTWQRFTKTFTIPTVAGTNTMAAFEIAGIDATAYFTGFQAELGSVATDFEYPKSFADELRLCQRYYEKSYRYEDTVGSSSNNDGNIDICLGSNNSGTVVYHLRFFVEKRANPTVTAYRPDTGASGQWLYGRSGLNSDNASVTVDSFSTKSCRAYFGIGSHAYKVAFLQGLYTAEAEF